jgi:hypothetical protein
MNQNTKRYKFGQSTTATPVIVDTKTDKVIAFDDVLRMLNIFYDHAGVIGTVVDDLAVIYNRLTGVETKTENAIWATTFASLDGDAYAVASIDDTDDDAVASIDDTDDDRKSPYNIVTDDDRERVEIHRAGWGVVAYLAQSLPLTEQQFVARDLVAPCENANPMRDEPGGGLVDYLNAIANLGGNVDDDRLTTATGANDARFRGELYVTARKLARAALASIDDTDDDTDEGFSRNIDALKNALVDMLIDYEPPSPCCDSYGPCAWHTGFALVRDLFMQKTGGELQ